MAKTEIFGEVYCDINDLECPKCGSEDFEWDEHEECDPDSDVWICECCECGHRFRVLQESFYRVEDEE